MFTARSQDRARWRQFFKIRMWLGGTVLVFLTTTAVAEDLHAKVCSAAVQIMLGGGEVSGSGSVEVGELRAIQPRLAQPLGAAMQRLLSSMDSISTILRSQQVPSQLQHEEFNNALMDVFTLLRPDTSNPSTPLADLPERLDFALVLYVSWSQIGSLRPAREQRDNYLGLGIPELAESIERDLLRDDWFSEGTPDQLQLLRDAQTRWRYIAKLLDRVTGDPAPLIVGKQIGLIRADLLSLRQARL
jgi:hypothetical protein